MRNCDTPVTHVHGFLSHNCKGVDGMQLVGRVRASPEGEWDHSYLS